MRLVDLIVTGNEGPAGRGITAGEGVDLEIDRALVHGNNCTQGNGGGVELGRGCRGRISSSLVAGNSASGRLRVESPRCGGPAGAPAPRGAYPQ